MSVLIEQYVPVVREHGIVTNKAAAFNGPVSFTGSVTKPAVVLGSSGNTSPAAAQSGSTFLFDSATGITFTLPPPVVGLDYTFIITATVTSGSHKVVTDASTTFLLGIVAVMEAAATTALGALANGTSSRSITMNGTTTGGILGTKFTLTCVTATQWEISGIVAGSGSLSTPIATS